MYHDLVLLRFIFSSIFTDQPDSGKNNPKGSRSIIGYYKRI